MRARARACVRARECVRLCERMRERERACAQLIVAVNKMDSIGWDVGRYEFVVKQLGQFLRSTGFREKDTFFVPCRSSNMGGTISGTLGSLWGLYVL